MKKRLLSLLLVLLTLCLASCGKSKGTATDDGFIDSNTGIEYVYCKPMGLYAVGAGEEYLTVKEKDVETVYHEVEFESPERFLCYEDSGEYLLLRAKDVEEPDVLSFNPIAASIYGSTNTVYITRFYADNKYLPEDKQEHNPTEDSWICQLIAKQLTEGEAVEVPSSSISDEDMYFIRLLSQDYPGLYYLVVFYGDTNGRYYLYDRAAGKTVYCPRDIILRMVGEE